MSTKIKINSQIFQDSNNIYYPKDESEVSDLIRELYKQDSPTEIIGNNSKSFIGNKTQSANTTSLSKISGIIDYRPEELYIKVCLLYTSPSPRDQRGSRMPSSA